MENSNLKFLQEELKRVTNLIQFSDKKIAFISTFYSIILGLLISKGNVPIQQVMGYTGWIKCICYFIFIIMIISFALGFIFILRTVFPKLKNVSSNQSLLYFGYVTQIHYSGYLKNYIKMMEENKMEEQMLEQIHTNSVIAYQKMKNVQLSIISLIVTIATCLALAIFYLIIKS